MPSFRCPICDRPVDPNQAPAMPFCSERCRLVDLQRWLEENYGFPDEPEEEQQGPNEVEQS
jgi:endogenous inhibitor of DNA gyrase (YacG/DUF329 family)